jgi:Ca2+-binding RTX toxin-like protein
VVGGSANDTLTGGDATNQWFNGEKFEWFQGNGGNDSIDGGRGTAAAMTEATREYNFARYATAPQAASPLISRPEPPPTD